MANSSPPKKCLEKDSCISLNTDHANHFDQKISDCSVNELRVISCSFRNVIKIDKSVYGNLPNVPNILNRDFKVGWQFSNINYYRNNLSQQKMSKVTVNARPDFKVGWQFSKNFSFR